ncbi:MAG: 3-hydroxyacyl-ACP dehydratase FabZ [Clostridiales Family XIII bacterium]|nr:3-hydroxyacyl-ACP dehydratase FabZ [Clostridiales Family XIII bacterium]
MLNLEQIKEIIPQREPFLFIDEVESIEPGGRVVAIRRVRADEDWCRGHFPGEPIMPGVLIIEAMAQTGAVGVLSSPAAKGRNAYFGGIDRAKFRDKVVPGDVLRLEVELTGIRSRGGKGMATAYKVLADGSAKVCASCEITFMFG